MKTREEGFYWVKTFPFTYYPDGVWKVAEYDGRYWYVISNELQFVDDDFAEIIENRIKRV